MANRVSLACMSGPSRHPRTVSARSIIGQLGAVPSAGGPAYQELAEGLRRLVADGRILDGTRLPSERELTAALGVSRTTVAGAYAVLRDRGYLHSRRGSGSVVTVPGGRRAGGPLHPGATSDADIDLSIAAPSAPPGMAEAFEDAVQELPHHLSGAGYSPFGLPELREVLAHRYGQRGLPTSPGQIMVTTGALAALSVVLRGSIGPGDRVLMESPTYPNALASVRDSGARTVGLPLDPQGLDAHALEVALRQSSATLAYLIPDFQNPTGLLVDDATRERAGAALRRQRTIAVIDETPVDLGIDVEPEQMPRPMAAFADSAVTIGSSSKTYWGGLRVGWLRAPERELPRFEQSRLGLDLGVPVLEQLVLRRLLSEGDHPPAHRREQLRSSRDALVSGLRSQLPDWRFVVPAGGLSVWCELPQPRSSAVCDAAAGLGVRLAPGSAFGVEGGLESFLRIPFALAPDVLTDAVGRIARAWELAEQGHSPQRPRVSLIA